MKTKNVENIQKGEVILTQLRKVKGEKVQLEFAELVDTPASNRIGDGGYVQMGNQSDERFGRNARRAWASFQPEDIAQVHPEIADQIKECAEGELYNEVEINWLSPKATNPATGEQKNVYVQVLETVQPTRSNLNYRTQGRGPLTDIIKQDSNGNYLRTEDGYGIFSNTRPVIASPEDKPQTHGAVDSEDSPELDNYGQFDHIFIQHADMVPDPMDVKIKESELRPNIVGDAQEEEETQKETEKAGA